MTLAGQISTLSTRIGTEVKAKQPLINSGNAVALRGTLEIPMVGAALAAADSNIAALTGLPTVDGVSIPSGFRVLLTAQTTGHQNGEWVVAAGAWARPADYPVGASVFGRTVQVIGGTRYGGILWVQMDQTAKVVGTDSTTWQPGNKLTGAVVASAASKATQSSITSTTAVDLTPSIVTTSFVPDGSQYEISWSLPPIGNNTGILTNILLVRTSDSAVVDFWADTDAGSNYRTTPSKVTLDTPTAGTSTGYKLQANTGATGQVNFFNTSNLGQYNIVVRHP